MRAFLLALLGVAAAVAAGPEADNALAPSLDAPALAQDSTVSGTVESAGDQAGTVMGEAWDTLTGTVGSVGDEAQGSVPAPQPSGGSANEKHGAQSAGAPASTVSEVTPGNTIVQSVAPLLPLEKNSESLDAKAQVDTTGSLGSVGGKSILDADKQAKIEKIFCLHLDRDTKRELHIKAQLDKQSMGHEMVQGVLVPDAVAAPDAAELWPEGCQVDLTATTQETNKMRSCCSDFAHRRAYNQVAKQSGDGYYLVVEDDIVFKDGWEQSFKEAMKTVPQDWDLLKIGHWGRTTDSDLQNADWYKAVLHDNDPAGWYQGSHAVVLTPSKAKAFLDKLKVHKGEMADKWVFYDGPIGLKVYALKQNVIVRPDDTYEKFGSSRADGTINVNYLKESTADKSIDGGSGLKLMTDAPSS